jgi:hypothetical protein
MRTPPWNLLLPVAFAIGCIPSIVAIVLDLRSVGSHASVYTAAAATWIAGGNPWSVGPPAALFAGPPPMLLLFVPSTLLPGDLNRVAWVAGMLIVVLWTIRRLELPGYWLGFPPFVQAIHLGHFEPLVLAMLLVGGPASGLIALVKPYAALPLVGERRWTAIAIALAVGLITVPILPWSLFLEQLPEIGRRIVTQANGDSVFPDPIWMLLALVSLGVLGFRRACWLAVPVVWPYAQSMYKLMTVPQLSPFMAAIWALPFPGATLAAVVVEAFLVRFAHRYPAPDWLRTGIGSASTAAGSTTIRAE